MLQVVGIVSLLSALLHLPPSLVGLTLLAWGNSLGDFFGNPAIARVGHMHIMVPSNITWL